MKHFCARLAPKTLLFEVWPKYLRPRLRVLRVMARRQQQTGMKAEFVVLRDAGQRMEKTTQGLEAQFLKASSQFEELTLRTQQFVKEVETLVSLATGREQEGLLFASTVKLIQDASAYLVCCQAQCVQMLRNLHAFSSQIEQLLRVEPELQRTIAPLKFIQNLFCSECAPLGVGVQQMFNALTQEMESLHGKVREIFGTQFKQLDQSHQIIRQVIAKLNSHEQLLAQRITNQDQQIEAMLGTLARETASNRERDVRLSRLSKEIAREVDQVVMGMQFQDIISQKLQHVATELAQIQGHYAAMNPAAPEAELGGKLQFLRQSCALLARQIEVSGDELSHAEDGIKKAIENVLRHLTEMDSQSLSLDEFKLLTTSFDGMVQVLLETITEIRELMELASASASDAYALLQPLGGLASDLTVVVRGLSAHIHLLGLNAQVQAARAASDTQGAGGAGLEVLSARTSEISAETGRLSEQAATRLDELAAGLAESVAVFGQLRAGCLEQQALLSRQGTQEEQQLHAFRDNAFAILRSIGNSFAEVRQQANQALQCVSFQEFREGTLQALQQPLRQIAAKAGQWMKDENWAPAEASLVENFKRDYTMASELQVFNEVMASHPAASGPQPAPIPASAPAASCDLFAEPSPNAVLFASAEASHKEEQKAGAEAPTPSGASDLGSNVELF